MPSLTPTDRSIEAIQAATYDGIISFGLTLVPSTFVVYTAMKNKKFVRATNWQSRTALVIMPSLFMYAISSEMKLNHKMEEMASENAHHKEVSRWAEENQKQRRGQESSTYNSHDKAAETLDVENQLHKIYQKSVEESGVRIVEGDKLGVHHKIANFWQENPFKILTALGVPSVLYIFRGKNEQRHLQLQSKLMHTRVYGQFLVIGILLTLMGFKNYMDTEGKFITEKEASNRVEEMKKMRETLLDKIEFEKKMKTRRERMLLRNEGKSKSLNKKRNSRQNVDAASIKEI